ncbi:hypothetical protein PROPEN_02785 [Proteus penneri ATCC 35198]|nr:hypothetical protein PROPEN_02785 [Proteus penneri ATCC 35198]
MATLAENGRITLALVEEEISRLRQKLGNNFFFIKRSGYRSFRSQPTEYGYQNLPAIINSLRSR